MWKVIKRSLRVLQDRSIASNDKVNSIECKFRCAYYPSSHQRYGKRIVFGAAFQKKYRPKSFL